MLHMHQCHLHKPIRAALLQGREFCIQFQEPKLTSREVASLLGNLTSEVTCEKTTFETQYYDLFQTNKKLNK